MFVDMSNTDQAIPFESLLQLATCSSDSTGLAQSVHITQVVQNGWYIFDLASLPALPQHSPPLKLEIDFLVKDKEG